MLSAALALVLAGCGSGDEHYHAIGALGLRVLRVGFEAVQLDWTWDPAAAAYTVLRDGYPLARIGTTTLIDASVLYGGRYCYEVLGRDAAGVLVSESPLGCIVIH